MKTGALNTALYASPHATTDLDPEPALLALINGAKVSILASIYSLTLGSVADALVAAAARGVQVRIVADATEAAEPTSLVPSLAQQGLDVHLWGAEYRECHAKVGIFDGKSVALGSYNWSNEAELDNVEVFVVFTGVEVARGGMIPTLTAQIEAAYAAGSVLT